MEDTDTRNDSPEEHACRIMNSKKKQTRRSWCGSPVPFFSARRFHHRRLALQIAPNRK
jgi:hypothetical protein